MTAKSEPQANKKKGGENERLMYDGEPQVENKTKYNQKVPGVGL